MGTVAGALGSSFDSAQSVVQAYNKREQERLGKQRERRLQEEQEPSGQ
jgi:hypothetical protein